MKKFLAEAKRQEDQLYDLLAACPVVELTGVVSADGVGAGQSPGQELWSLLLSFDAWRIGAGPVRTDSLTIRRRVTDQELERYQDTIEPDTVIQVRARVADESASAHPQALLEEIIQLHPNDAELQAHSADLQQPVTHEDDRFGTLVFDRRVSWYSAEVRWNGDTVKLNVNVDEPDELELALRVAYSLWDREASWNDRVRDYAVQELLPVKNDSWLDDNETELSPFEFKERLRVESISVYADGEFEFLHEDGDLFGGHAIEVCGNLEEGPVHADIPG